MLCSAEKIKTNSFKKYLVYEIIKKHWLNTFCKRRLELMLNKGIFVDMLLDKYLLR